MDALALIYCPFPDAESATRMAEALVAARLVACANLLPPTRSIYHWDGALTQTQEHVALLKTRQKLVVDVRAFIAQHHPYQTPAILSWPLEANAPWAHWAREMTQTPAAVTEAVTPPAAS